MTGPNRGPPPAARGITLNRLRDGRIVENRSAIDTVEPLRPLGLGPALLAVPRMLRALRDPQLSGA